MKNLPGQILVENEFITKTARSSFGKAKTMPGKLIGDVLIEMNFNQKRSFQALAMRLKVPYVDLDTVQINIDAVKKIPENLARKHTVIAYSVTNNRLTVATNDPVNFYIFEELKVITGMEIHAMLATKTSIVQAIDRAYSQQQVSNVMDDLNREIQPTDILDADQDGSIDRIDNAPIVKLVNTMVQNAFRMNASDIHIEPFKDRTRVRFRRWRIKRRDEAILPTFTVH